MHAAHLDDIEAHTQGAHRRVHEAIQDSLDALLREHLPARELLRERMVLASSGYPPAASSATRLEFINGVSVETLRHACTSWIVTFWPCECVNSMIFAPYGGLRVIPENTR